MLRHVIAAAVLSLAMDTTAARATTVISGTWRFEVDAWPLLNSTTPHPPPPVIGSATLSLETGVSVDSVASDFTSNFGSASPAYLYDGADNLLISFTGVDPGLGSFFIEAQFIDVSVHLIEPSVPPMLQDVSLIPSLNVKLSAEIFSGSFTPTPVPEPSAWVMLLLGFAGFGFGASRKHRQHSKAGGSGEGYAQNNR